MYSLGEVQFGTAGPAMVAKGWSVLPQEHVDGRGTARVGGYSIKWRPYQTVRPTDAEIRDWALMAPGSNVAIVLGAASGHAFALDIDIDDDVASRKIQTLAAQYLGRTPFQRVGRAPRIVLFYRHADGERLRKVSRKYVDIGAVEVLGDGSMVTAYGRHHKTGSYFQWMAEGRPSMHGPETAPLISQDALDAFFEALDREYTPIDDGRRARAKAFHERPAVVGDLVVPVGADRVSGVQYIDGKAVDGRETLLNWIAARFATHNPDAGLEALHSSVVQVFRDHARIEGKWETSLVDMARERVLSAKQAVAEGRLTAKRIYRAEDGSVYAPARIEPEPAGPDPDIKALAPAKRKPLEVLAMTKPDPDKAARRALLEDRSQVTEATSKSVVKAIRDWLGEVRKKRVRADDVILKAPTGAGKTSAFVRIVGEEIANNGRIGGPIVMMMPSYQNIEEAVSRAPPGLRTQVYMGKVRAGCARAEELELLTQAGVGTAGLCEAKDDQGEPVYCPHFVGCPALDQRRRLHLADVVFMPMAFLDKNLPKELKKSMKALVIDERCFGQFVDAKTFAAAVLDIGRPDPYDTKTEQRKAKEAGVVLPAPEEHSMAREKAVGIAMKALRAGRDVARAFLDASDGEMLLDSVRRVMARADITYSLVRPDLTRKGVEEIASQPKLTGLWAEKRFWAIVDDRHQKLKSDRFSEQLQRQGGGKAEFTRSAKGDTDARIQLLKDGSDEYIRVSWRSKTNFPAVPTMLLDASAAPEIAGKVFNKNFRVIDIDAPLHLRTIGVIDQVYSDTALIPEKHPDEDGKRERAAKNLYAVRTAISSICGVFGNDRVIVGSTKKVRESMHRNWRPPDNLDSVHFGALRGLDFAKHHGVAVCIGRMELGPRAIDGIVGALTYDDEIPETPIDYLGTGCDHEGNPLPVNMSERTYPLRDGRDVTVRIPRCAGRWAELVQRQYREEETRQFIGRLRPVYREGKAPLAIIMSSVIPEGVILDDVMTLDDLRVHYQGWEAVRRTGLADAHRSCVETLDIVDATIMSRFMREISECGADRGLMEFEYRLEGQDRIRRIRAPMFVPHERLEWALRRAHDGLVYLEDGTKAPARLAAGVTIVSGKADMSLALPKKPDAMDLSFGTPENRAYAEDYEFHQALATMWDEILKFGFKREDRKYPLRITSKETMKEETRKERLVDLGVRMLFERRPG
ncbi:bifunctional DNA primase/polymerase [Methylosinus sp. PW1]|uniref:bifunctional DNA primase/polymerase n=1 Tax=Methylosinus sp. PW1 TaxID=107636 RepID=UPI0018DC41F1|nr:bifunctional DNA primase/polymerase [Methylosinus sp. PW1]